MERWGGASQAKRMAWTVEAPMKVERLQDKGMKTIKVMSFSLGWSGSAKAEGLPGLPEAGASTAF